MIKVFQICLLCVLMFSFFFISLSISQQDQASLLLELKKARASYEIAKQKLENDRKLFDNKAISEDEFNQSKRVFKACCLW